MQSSKNLIRILDVKHMTRGDVKQLRATPGNGALRQKEIILLFSLSSFSSSSSSSSSSSLSTYAVSSLWWAEKILCISLYHTNSTIHFRKKVNVKIITLAVGS